MIVVETRTSASPERNEHHPVFELTLPHLAVRDDHAKLGRELLELPGGFLDRLDAVVQEEALPATLLLPGQRGEDELFVVFADMRADRAAALRRRLDHGDVAEAGERHVQCPRDRRRAQCEHVDLEPQLAQELLLSHTETLLLVDDDEAEIFRNRIAGEDPVGADQHVDLALAELGQHPLDLGRLAEARDHLDAHREVAVALAERVPVLLGEDRRGDEHQHLFSTDGHRERGTQCDLRLAEADVTADEAVHRPRRLEIFLHGLDRARLVFGLAIGEVGLEPFHPFLIDVVGDTDPGLALGIELKQLAGHLTKVRARAVLEVVPGLAAELREGGRVGVRADVARHLADLLVGHIDAILAAEAEQQVVAGDAGDLPRLEAEEL